jgi:hypothetical protein
MPGIGRKSVFADPVVEAAMLLPSKRLPPTPDNIVGQRIGSIFIQVANFMRSETRLIDFKEGAHQGRRGYFLDREAERLGSRVKPFVPEIACVGLTGSRE